MASFFFYSFLSPLAITFLIPGLLLTMLVMGKERKSLLSFLIEVACWGFVSQLIISFLVNLTVLSGLNSKIAIFIIVGTYLSGLLLMGWVIFKKEFFIRLRLIEFSVLELLTILLIVLVIFGFINQVYQKGYFNPATDQYFWQSFAEGFFSSNPVSNKTLLINLFDTRQFYKLSFAQIIAPYSVFYEKSVKNFQYFTVNWTIFCYLLLMMAMANLSREVLRGSVWFVLAPLVFLVFHWNNYYLISTGVVPQNLGMFFFIVGLGFLSNKRPNWIIIGIFSVVFYLIHFASFLMFALVTSIFWVLKSLRPPFGLIMAIMLIIYILIFGIDLWSENYRNTLGYLVMTSALLGLLLLLFKKDFIDQDSPFVNVLIAGFLVPSFFLSFSWIPHSVLPISWHVFRYLLFLYPIFVLTALYLFVKIFVLLKTLNGKLFFKIEVFLVVFIAPFLIVEARAQQQLVILDMIIGRDGGQASNLKINIIQELMVARNISKFDNTKIFYIAPGLDHPYPAWVFAPNLVYNLSHCDFRCFTKLLGKDSLFYPSLVFLERNDELLRSKSEIIALLVENGFVKSSQSSHFVFYKKKFLEN